MAYLLNNTKFKIEVCNQNWETQTQVNPKESIVSTPDSIINIKINNTKYSRVGRLPDEGTLSFDLNGQLIVTDNNNTNNPPTHFPVV
ncbi:hypothetical protein [Cetobacterium sp.]|uniref:hypothetical protein n=1 Tax=Cetobacterium sp. TaxID=2071632 RepID=UPI003F2DAA32